MPTLRPATENDLPAIGAILNHYIQHTTARFDTELWEADRLAAWFAGRGDRHPVIVAEQDGRVLGYAALNPYDRQCAYDDTAELSAYLLPDETGRGLGRRLIEAVLEQGRQAGVYNVLSRISAESEASLRLHEKLAFETIGTFREAGQKFGRRIDVVFLQKRLK